jgi:ABC-type antimicrobial peptide transport system permease subunit
MVHHCPKESIVVCGPAALASAVLGLLLAVGLFRLQPVLMPPSQVALGLDLRLDTTLILFTMAASMLAVLIFGFAPALQATRLDYAAALKRGETGADQPHC